MFIAMILESILILERLQADVACKARRVVVVNREMLRKPRWKCKALSANGTFVCLVIVIQFVVLQAILALEALVALLALVDFIVVHDLMLLETNQCREEFVTDATDLSGARSMLILMVFETILTFEFLVALEV